MSAFDRPGRPNPLADEYVTLVFTVPVLIAFIPGYQDEAAKAMQALAEAPEWVQNAVAASIAFTLGTRAIRGIRDLLPHPPRSIRKAAPLAAGAQLQ